MWRRLAAVVVAVAGLLTVLAPAAAQTQPQPAPKRHALLIGINDYKEIPRLEKAVGDAEALAAALQGFGYEVTLAKNPGRRELGETLARFLARIEPDDTVLVHYSGHGVEIEQQNFLLPADMPKLPGDLGRAAADYVRNEAMPVSDLMQRVSMTPAAVRIFILDACRDNPLAVGGVRSVGRRRGLNTQEPVPAGTFVLYSAGIGQQALDNLGPTDKETTSVYTRVLLRQLKRDSPLAGIAQEVRRDVAAMARRVGHLQSPAYYDEFIGSNEFYVDPARDPRNGWLPLCQGPAPGQKLSVWAHNGQQIAMTADGNKRRLHYVTMRPSNRDQGVVPDCVLIDGEVTGGKLKGKAHIYRAKCGMYPYDVEGDFAPDQVRLELRGAAPVPLENCRIARLDATSHNAVLVFDRIDPPPPVAATPASAPAAVAPTPAATTAPAQ